MGRPGVEQVRNQEYDHDWNLLWHWQEDIQEQRLPDMPSRIG